MIRATCADFRFDDCRLTIYWTIHEMGFGGWII